MTDNLTADRLRELVSYDPATGIFTWLKSSGRARSGSPAGSHSNGYLNFMVDGKRHGAHRLAFLYVTGEWPSGDVDHRNLIKSDNRWDNLRVASKSQNNANTTARSHNTTGFKGVFLNKKTGSYFAQIVVDGKQHHLGTFATAEQASAAYQVGAAHHFGSFARAS